VSPAAEHDRRRGAFVAAMAGAGTRSRVGAWLFASAIGCGGSVGVAPVAGDPAEPPVSGDQAAALAIEPEPTPAPESEPEPVATDRAPAPDPAPPSVPSHADLDPDNDAEVGPPPALDDCEARLVEAGVTWKPARIGVGRKVDGVYTCGSPQVVRYRAGPGKIAYSTSPLLTCRMALALADFERIVQEEAERELGRRIAKIEHLGTYNCREMAAYDLISEHSFANAIDLRRFHLQGGGTVDVLKDFRPKDDAPSDPKTKFLRGLGHRLYDEGVFSVVVTPFFDALHRNHIHVDLARYRVDGSRP
jgi:hypothetical protein